VFALGGFVRTNLTSSLLALLLLGIAPNAWSMDLASCADPGQKDADGAVVSYASRSELTLMTLNESLVVSIAHKFDYEVAPKIFSSTVTTVSFASKSGGEGYELELADGKSLLISTQSYGRPWFELLANVGGHETSVISNSNCAFSAEGLNLLKARVRR
jgi:hypothetical protein